MKLNATGSAVLRATYFGGGAVDEADSVALDQAGNVYVYGGTGDRNRSGSWPPATIPFPRTPGAYRTTDNLNCNGVCPDSGGVFIAKFSNDLSRLFYSTIIGTGGPGGGFAHIGTSLIAVDSAGNAYITGATNSPSFPTTPGAWQRVGGAETSLIGAGDAFVTKLSADGSRLICSTYLGGNAERTGGSGIAVDTQGFAYVTGIMTARIDLGAETDQVFLILFGTGWRNRLPSLGVSARIGDLEAPVIFAGAQGSLAGLDQVNLRLPRALNGRGEVEVTLNLEQQPTNNVKVSIK